MTNATTLLNSIALALNTTDKTLVINAAMGLLIGQGLKASEAMDLIMGEGSYKAFAGQVYDALRAKAAA